jgi:hypothetical protein
VSDADNIAANGDAGGCKDLVALVWGVPKVFLLVEEL